MWNNYPHPYLIVIAEGKKQERPPPDSGVTAYSVSLHVWFQPTGGGGRVGRGGRGRTHQSNRDTDLVQFTFFACAAGDPRVSLECVRLILLYSSFNHSFAWTLFSIRSFFGTEQTYASECFTYMCSLHKHTNAQLDHNRYIFILWYLAS